jgi:pentatricopeptide repeat protein
MAEAIIVHEVDGDSVLVSALTTVVRTLLNEGRYLDAMHVIAYMQSTGMLL